MANISNLTTISNSSDTSDIFEIMSAFHFPALVLCLIGIPGTIKAIHFYGKQSRKSVGATPTLLTALAVYDTMSLVTSVPYICLAINMAFIDRLNGPHLFFCTYYIPNYLVRFPKYCSNILLMIIATCRLYSVVWPFTWKKVFSRNVGLCCIWAITLVIPLSLLPLAFEYSCTDVANRTVYSHQLSNIGKNHSLYQTIYILNMILYYSIPLFTVIVCNIALIAFLLHRRYNPVTAVPLTSTQARELKTTKLILVLTCIFVVCVSPLGIFYPLRSLGDSPFSVSMHRAVVPVANLLEVINYSSNTLVYYIGSVHFRDEVMRDVCCKGSRVNMCCKRSRVSPSYVTPVP